MSQIRLYLDEDAGQGDLIAALRLRSVDVTRAQESGLMGAADIAQLDWCRTHGRVLYTFNVGDFYDLHSQLVRAEKNHLGVIIAPQQTYSVGEQMRRLLRLIGSLTPEEMRNRIEFLSAWGSSA